VVRQLEDRSRVRLNPVSIDTTDVYVLRDVGTGKVDAGLVFKNEALNAVDNVSWFAFPEADDATVTSWVASLKNSDQAELAKKFVQDVTDSASRKVFADAGFAEPDEKFEG
jgi:molybdate transport system substrate-binding protein